jgi:opacity protein-like surface antigen
MVMKSSFLGSVALFAFCVSVTARTADMPVKAPPAPPPPYNWSGFYLGANLGGAWTSGSLNIPGNNLYGGLTEFIGGVQAGYNFQAGHLLFGVEGDFDGATFGHPALPTPTLGSVSQNGLERWQAASDSLRIVGLSTASLAVAGCKAMPR